MATNEIARALQALALPFIQRVDVLQPGAGRAHMPDTKIVIRTPTGDAAMRVEVKRTHLTHALVDGVVARAGAANEDAVLVMAPYVPPLIAERLAAADVNFIDEAGNYRIAIGDRYLAERTGRKPHRKPAGQREVRLAGYQVLFTLLAEPKAIAMTVRELADLAGVGKTAAAEALRTLAAQGLIGTGPHRRVLQRREMLDRWLAGYATYVRPRLFLGTHRTPHANPPQLEAAIADAMPPGVAWAFGGGAAAYRLTRYYRGPTTVVHIAAPAAEITRPLRALEAQDGPLILLGAPGPIALQGIEEHTAHPLLIFTELYAEGTDRARDAARELAGRYLEDLP